MVTLTIKYYSLGNKRYLRSLNFEEFPKEFINHPLNLGFIKIKNKKDLDKDFNICCKIIKKEGGNLKVNYTY